MSTIDMEQYRPGDHNQTARRVLAANAAVSMIPFENRKAQRAADIPVIPVRRQGNRPWCPEEHARRLVVMLGYVGEIANLLERGDARYEDPLLKLASAALAWLDANEADRAR